MPLQAGVERVLSQYPSAVREPLTAHPLAELIRGPLADELQQEVGSAYLVKGSPGQGNWAATPWVSVFERSITTTARRGFYLVYLFRGDGAAVYLSLNQGTTEVYDQVGASSYQQVLANQATLDASLLRPHGIDGLQVGPLDLPGDGYLTRGYNAGNICARKYNRGAVPADTALLSELQRFLDLYAFLIEARAAISQVTGEELPDGVKSGEEAKRFRWHRRAERNPRLARDAKRYHGTTCTVCLFDFARRYGPLGEGYIEAHHLTPLAELARRPSQVILDPKTDFTVVCANCHRMLHHGSPSPTVAELRASLRPD
jgi:5-methylcytosine-specific restriction protein A